MCWPDSGVIGGPSMEHAHREKLLTLKSEGDSDKPENTLLEASLSLCFTESSNLKF